MSRPVRRVYRQILRHMKAIATLPNAVQQLMAIEQARAVGLDSAVLRSRNPLCQRPRSYWSQADEDGILEAILGRVQAPRRFLEIGVGNGLENNTAYLLSVGWLGAWIGDEELAIEVSKRGPLKFIRGRVDLSNLSSFLDAALGAHVHDLGVVSVDIDGNDYHLVNGLLEQGVRPAVWIIEYNGCFPVGSKWVMPYDPNHVWNGSDYFGASLTSLSELLGRFGYGLVACSSQGANAFFVEQGMLSRFSDCPQDESDIYMPPLYRFPRHVGHTPDPRTLELILSESRVSMESQL